MNKRPLAIIGTILAISVTILGVRVFTACEKVEIHSKQGVYYYWLNKHSKAHHGICAAMYGNKEESIWEVDVPDNGPTPSYVFNSKNEAENFAEAKCYSNHGTWQVIDSEK